MQERLAVVEEVDANERGAGFVDHAPEEIEVEHAGLTRAGDAGFRRAARLVQEMLQAAVHSMYIRDGSGPASIGRPAAASSFLSGSFSGQSPQNFEPPAFSPRAASR